MISNSSWRYQKVKGWRKRAVAFRDAATSDEERVAWTKVVDWFDAIMKRDRFFEHGVIRMANSESAKEKIFEMLMDGRCPKCDSSVGGETEAVMEYLRLRIMRYKEELGYLETHSRYLSTNRPIENRERKLTLARAKMNELERMTTFLKQGRIEEVLSKMRTHVHREWTKSRGGGEE